VYNNNNARDNYLVPIHVWSLLKTSKQRHQKQQQQQKIDL